MGQVHGMEMMTQVGSNKKIMKNYYYIFWADAIHRAKASNPKGGNWKRFSFLFISFIHGLNLFILFVWFSFFSGNELSLLRLNIFEFEAIDKLLSFFIEFVSLPIMVNYFLIFHNKRYEKIISKHPLGKSKISANYSMIIIVLAFISVVLYSLIR